MSDLYFLSLLGQRDQECCLWMDEVYIQQRGLVWSDYKFCLIGFFIELKKFQDKENIVKDFLCLQEEKVMNQKRLYYGICGIKGFKEFIRVFIKEQVLNIGRVQRVFDIRL